ncbi:hypothetical protein PAXINDRAFT_91575 [Paxillus involutus ATCC 200175]|uniref:Uncharacterized protein n=1 Tax=Paxillus involutus ATCC 200175 TaxID=664439 RepID=A0A0C9SVP8_PAXIN|nr:hypothetical protein PAXINDRAFT_91575 [Paxillus involutus ATCC 200175]
MKPSSEGQTWNARKKRKVLDPAMDCLINANFRAGFQCRRKVFHIHFNNASSGEKPDWREQKTKDVYGESHLIDLGPGLVMPDSVLEHIIACAHHLKISTVDDLRRETRWSGTDKFGSEVISVIHCIIPVPVSAPAFSTTPLQRRSVPQSAATSATISNSLAVYPDETNHGQSIATSAKKNKCGVCGLEGHNSKCFQVILIVFPTNVDHRA